MDQLKIKNPFQLFPQEIWELTLDQIEDSKDILTVLRGIPKVDISISNQKRLWLIGEILPNFYNLMDQKEVLNLRLVCKDWQRRVDHFLQNQPYYRAYSEDLHKDNPRFWAFLEKSEENRFKNGNRFRKMYGIVLNLLLDKMLEHPRNPFVFREIDLAINEMYEGNDGSEYWKELLKIMTLLQRFGTQIWYISITIFVPEQHAVTHNLGETLKLVPNLKRLTVDFPSRFGSSYDDEELCKSQLLQNLPELPFLETLEIRGYLLYSSIEIGKHLINQYGSQLRRIVAPDNCWTEETTNKLTKLTELDLRVCYFEVSYNSDHDTIKNFFGSIRCPNLVKLEIWFFNENQPIGPLGVEQDILAWLKRFPNIKYLRILTPYDYSSHEGAIILLKEEGTADPVKDIIPSLQTLKIVNSPGLSYNFLRCFPSLQDLEIRPYSFPTVEDLSIPDSGVKLREQIQTGRLYESNIWEVLPKLKSACLEPFTEDCSFCKRIDFYRESYEKLKIAGRLPSEPELHAFRSDVRNFISPSAMDDQFLIPD